MLFSAFKAGELQRISICLMAALTKFFHTYAEINVHHLPVSWWRCLWCNGYCHRKWTRPTRVQILDEADCISHSTKTLGKGMNPIILPPAMGK